MVIILDIDAAAPSTGAELPGLHLKLGHYK